MTDGIFFLSAFATSAARMAACLAILRGLSPRQCPKGWLAAAIAGGAAASALLCALRAPDLFHWALEALSIAACGHCGWKASLRISLCVGIFYEIAVSLWQFLLGAWLGAAFCNPAFLRAGTMEGQAAIWLLHAPLCALPLYLAKRPDAARKTLPRLASAAIVVGFLAVVSLSGQKALALPKDILDMWTMLSILLIMAFLFLRLRRQYDTEKEVARLKSERAELLEREYAALNHAYAANAKLFHDTQNHLGALRQLLLHGKPAEALAYLDTLQAPVREIASDARTGDETLDYLIGSKAAAAQARGIAYQAQVEFPRRTNLRGADLCAIVGNLLDNAIEAAGQVPEPERRFVHLTIRRIHQMLVIKVENRFAAAPMEENGALKTTKTAGGLHGWGLKSAQAAAEKYDGTLQTSFTGDVFCSVATLSFQGVPESPPPQKGNS